MLKLVTVVMQVMEVVAGAKVMELVVVVFGGELGEMRRGRWGYS